MNTARKARSTNALLGLLALAFGLFLGMTWPFLLSLLLGGILAILSRAVRHTLPPLGPGTMAVVVLIG